MSFMIPEVVLLTAASVLILVELFLAPKLKQITFFSVQLSLLIVTVMTVMQMGEAKQVTFNGLYIADDVARIMKIFIYITTIGVFTYSRQYVTDRAMPNGEFYILGLLSVLGMSVVVSAHSLLTIYLGLELLSLPLYAMVALQRDSGRASEAAMKYFVMGAIASGMLLYGMSLLYGATGALDLDLIAKAVANYQPAQANLLAFSLVFIIAGIGFKFAAVPFHMWAPDVYTGAPTAVTNFLSSAPKIAALGMTIRLLVFGMPSLVSQWLQLLVVLAVLSIGLGNLFAIAQTNLKRMLAYSGISHIGFMLLGLIAGTQQGYAYALFYILIYALTSIAAFGMIVLFSRAGIEHEEIEDFKGLNTRNPWLAFMMLIVMFSMAGVPPTVGFFAKLFVINAIVEVGFVGLAIFSVLFAVIGAFYYIRLVKVMYFETPEKTYAIKIPTDMTITISINGLLLLALGLFPGFILQACRAAFG